MAYKITKYSGKHKIKDTKSGKSVEIDIEKYMNGGSKKTEPTDKNKKKVKAKDINDDLENTDLDVRFYDEESGAVDRLFKPVDREPRIDVPDFDLGRYKDVGYFNINYANDQFNISPTKRNPGNGAKYKEYLDYLQKINPDVKVNQKPNSNGYLQFVDRLEYGGSITTTPEYSQGGDCTPGSPGYPDCLAEDPVNGLNYPAPPSTQKQDYDYYNDPEGIMMGQKVNVSTNVPPEEDFDLMNLEDEATANTDYMNTEEFKNNQSELANQYSKNQKSLQDYMQETIDQDKNRQNDQLSSAPEKDFSIFNPYAGVDIPTAAYTLGQSIENKNTLGIVGSGLKLATGLGRNLVSGMGKANRGNKVMQDYYEQQKNKRNTPEFFAYGGKKDEEIATGEYMRGVPNEDVDNYNAEIEKGEYFKTNEGDVAEVIGDKHSKGGEKVEMEAEDKVLSDKLKLGGVMAKSLSEKYDLNLKAKNTYSDVLDKFRKKSKLDKILEEEADVLKKISEQEKVSDATTRDFNLDVLSKKQKDIVDRKNPIEEERKYMFEELFDMQEMSKKEKNPEEDKFENGGKKVPKYENGVKIGEIDPRTGKKVTKEVAKQKVDAGEWEYLGAGNYIDRGTEGSTTEQDLRSYKETWDRNKFPNFKDYVNAAEQWKRDNPNWRKTQTTEGTPDERYYTEEEAIALKMKGRTDQLNITAPKFKLPTNSDSPAANIPDDVEKDLVIGDPEDIKRRNSGISGAYLFPDETPLSPSSLQGTIKPERRFDRVRATEIDVEPYLQDIRDSEESQIRNLEGLSPNVRAAILANTRANSQGQESKIRNQIDAQNIQSQEKANYSNASTQRMEENASAADRLKYEQRQYRAQSLTDNDLSNYYNQLQATNKQRFMDIHNLNLINSTNEDVYYDGSTYRRKNSDQEILRQVKV